jgi:hypothetical protein
VSDVVVELLGAAALELLLGDVALCALMSEVLLLVVLPVAGGVWLALLVPVWLADAPTPLELADWDGVALDGGVFWVWAAELPSAELV